MGVYPNYINYPGSNLFGSGYAGLGILEVSSEVFSCWTVD